MTRQQQLHVGMINSFNVITGIATFEEVIKSGIGVLAHVPNEDEIQYIKLMIYYFEEHELYEYCNVLKKYVKDNYFEDGSRREKECECEYPTITEYVAKVKCSKCNKRLFR